MPMSFEVMTGMLVTMCILVMWSVRLGSGLAVHVQMQMGQIAGLMQFLVICLVLPIAIR